MNGNAGTGSSLIFGHSQSGTTPTAKLYTFLVDGSQAGRTGDLRFQTASAGALADRVTIQSSGNVGIGTTSPTQKLSLFNGHLLFSNAYGLLASGGAAFKTGSGGSTWGVYPGTSSSNILGVFNYSGSQVFGIDASGRVGLGTSIAEAPLHIYGVATTDAFAGMGPSPGTGPAFNLGYGGASFGRGAAFMNTRPDASAVAPNPSLRFLTVNVERMIVTNTGNVGIGTSAPAAKLHTYESSPLGGSVGNNRLLERISGSTGNTVMRSLWMVRAAAGSDWNTAKVHDGIGVDNSFVTPGTDTKTWWERNPAASTQSWGNGNQTLMSLNAAGDLSVVGNLAAKYQDLAEWVPAKHRISAGTVVILDSQSPNEVIPSVTAYDTKVAGVISAQPGVLLGQAGEGKVMVATTGRVKVKVDANRGPVQIGDLLVTSDQPGLAMRSEPVELAGIRLHRPGTLVGKALEPLESGQGEILVLLSLQ